MSVLAIVILIAFCVGVILAIVTHLGYGIVRDTDHRVHLARRDRRVRRRRMGQPEQLP